MEISIKTKVKNILSRQWIAVLMGNILLFAVLTISQPAFLQVTNLVNILCQCSLFGIMAVGMTFVISTGGIDISVGMNALFTMALMWRLYNVMPVWLVFIVVLLFGSLIGAVNGMLICYFNFPEMIATLASMSILRGAGYLLLDTSQKFVQDELRIIGNSRVLGMIPTPTVIMILLCILLYPVRPISAGSGRQQKFRRVFRYQCKKGVYGRLYHLWNLCRTGRHCIRRTYRFHCPQFMPGL